MTRLSESTPLVSMSGSGCLCGEALVQNGCVVLQIQCTCAALRAAGSLLKDLLINIAHIPYPLPKHGQ